MRRSPELMQLEIGISTSRYLPASGTAGFARSLVSGNRRVPWPPPMITERTLLVLTDWRLVCVMAKPFLVFSILQSLIVPEAARKQAASRHRSWAAEGNRDHCDSPGCRSRGVLQLGTSGRFGARRTGYWQNRSTTALQAAAPGLARLAREHFDHCLRPATERGRALLRFQSGVEFWGACYEATG